MQIIEYIQTMIVLASNGELQGIFFWVSIYIFLMMIHSLVFQIKIDSWPSVAGHLVDKNITEFGYEYAQSHKEYKVSLSYKYVVDGKEYIGVRLSPWLFVTSKNAMFILKNQVNLILLKGDGMVSVYYNPKNP